MKSKKQIEQEIYDLKLEISGHEKIVNAPAKSNAEKLEVKKSKNKAKQIRSKLPFYKLCLSYIQSDPSPEFIKKEKDRITNRINATLESYVQPKFGSEIERRKDKREYEKSMEIPKLRKQLSTLYYLLK